MVFLLYSAIEKYHSSSAVGFDGMIALKSFGEFLGVFFGSFAMGAAMGSITALVSFTL